MSLAHVVSSAPAHQSRVVRAPAPVADEPIDILIPLECSIDSGDSNVENLLGVAYDVGTGKLVGDRAVLYSSCRVGHTIPMHTAVVLLGGLSHPASSRHVLPILVRDRLDRIAESTREERGSR